MSRKNEEERDQSSAGLGVSQVCHHLATVCVCVCVCVCPSVSVWLRLSVGTHPHTVLDRPHTCTLSSYPGLEKQVISDYFTSVQSDS